MPPLHVPSPSHGVPSGAFGFVHVPSPWHVPATWHTSDAMHMTILPMHVPFWHESFCVHGFPSLHDVPLGAA